MIDLCGSTAKDVKGHNDSQPKPISWEDLVRLHDRMYELAVKIYCDQDDRYSLATTAAGLAVESEVRLRGVR